MDTSCLIRCLFPILLYPTPSDGVIRCFDCTSETRNENCDDRFHTIGVIVKNCTGSCVKVKMYYSNKEKVVGRYCSPTKEEESCRVTDAGQEQRIEECYCHKDLCNATHTTTQIIPGLAVWIVVISIKVFFSWIDIKKETKDWHGCDIKENSNRLKNNESSCILVFFIHIYMKIVCITKKMSDTMQNIDTRMHTSGSVQFLDFKPRQSSLEVLFKSKHETFGRLNANYFPTRSVIYIHLKERFLERVGE